MKIIDPNLFCNCLNELWADHWLVLSCGDFAAGDYNAMTVGWGFFGVMWKRPAACVVVRPGRYTFEFLQRYRDFTLCAFPPTFHKALQYLGSHSGRDGDKIGPSGLNPVAARKVSAPFFAEAELVLECRSLYRDDFKPEGFLDPSIDNLYPQQDYHRFFIGEILEIRGIEKYR